ncbi:MAG: hypothetical protein JWP74_1758 [Marmoricola sp.]|nr:hypothetical protein [Marmoricola sp.]
MGRFTNPAGVTFSVDDSKDERYKDLDGYESVDGSTAKRAPAKKAAPAKSDS